MDWDFNFDDILKEHGVLPEEENGEGPAVPEEECLPEAENENLPEAEDDGFFERESEEAPPGREKQAAAEDEFDFDWPEPEAEPVRKPKRNYDPEKYPDAIRAREKEEARLKREKEARRKADAKEAERKRRENEREEERRLKEREREAAKASREAARQAEIRAKEAEREGRERDRQDREAGRRRQKEAQRKRAYQERRQGTIGLVIFVLLLAVIIGGVLYAGNRISNSDKNLPKVYIDNIAVGRMTRAETESALIAAGWQQKATTPLTVSSYGGVSVEVDPLEAGGMISMEKAVKEMDFIAAAQYRDEMLRLKSMEEVM